jgi:hypothetical protein
MKSRDFAELLVRLSKLSSESHSGSCADLCDLLLPVFQAKPSAKATEIFDAVEAAAKRSHSLSETVKVVTAQLTQKKRKSKPNVVREDVVAAYVAELEAELGKEHFAFVHAKLKARGAVSEPEAKLISKQFYGEAGSTKAAALANIWRRHQSIIDLKALGRATAGRSAA